VRDVLAALEEAGFLSESDDGLLTPARPLAQTTLADVRRVIAGAPPRIPVEQTAAKLAVLLEEGESAAVERLSGTTLEDLCRGMRPGSGAHQVVLDPGAAGSATRIPS